MIDAISGAWSGLTAAKDIAKGLMDLKEMAAVNSKAVELTGVILDIQDKLYNARTERDDLQRRIQELEAKLANADAWEQQKSRYRLATISDGCHIYLENGLELNQKNPPPYQCPTCFGNKELTLLQASGGSLSHRYYVCPKCQTKVSEPHGHRISI